MRSGEADIRTPRGCGLPDEAARILEGAGFSVAGVLDVASYDLLVPSAWRSEAWMPDARSALLLGTGGGGFEARWREAGGVDPLSNPEADPIDEFTRRALSSFEASLARSLGVSSDAAARTQLYCDRRCEPGAAPVFADFVALARASGLGAASRLGLLIHPTYGPWWSLRALVLTPFLLRPTLPTQPPYDPCAGCLAPCEVACPARAVTQAGFAGSVCASHRLASLPECVPGCAARRACVVGREQAFAAADEAVYASASLRWIRSEFPQG